MQLDLESWGIMKTILRKFLRDEVRLAPGETPWTEAYAGDVSFLCGDYKVTFFNDCDSLDYTDSIERQGVKIWDYAAADGRDPLNELTGEEQMRLEEILKAAKP